MSGDYKTINRNENIFTIKLTVSISSEFSNAFVVHYSLNYDYHSEYTCNYHTITIRNTIAIPSTMAKERFQLVLKLQLHNAYVF